MLLRWLSFVYVDCNCRQRWLSADCDPLSAGGLGDQSASDMGAYLRRIATSLHCRCVSRAVVDLLWTGPGETCDLSCLSLHGLLFAICLNNNRDFDLEGSGAKDFSITDEPKLSVRSVSGVKGHSSMLSTFSIFPMLRMTLLVASDKRWCKSV